MPEMPQMQGLADFLTTRAAGRRISVAALGSVQALKTVEPALDDLLGAEITGASRHGKWLDLAAAPMAAAAGETELHLVIHLARAGWLRWYERLPATPVRPGRSPIALRVGLDDGSGFDLTEAGTTKRLAIYVVRSAADVPMIASLGPDPLSPDLTPQVLGQILRRRNQQVKGVLRDQSRIAGIGNAYSDEILHAARMSPFAMTARLDDEAVARLHAAMGEVLGAAVAAASGAPASALKDAKRAGMRVHGRAGQTCGVCGDVIREVSFADSALQYCPTCQTGGKILADRRLSRLLR